MHERVWQQRWHPLREEWVLFTSHRGGRPWVGEKKRVEEHAAPSHDPTCALCPGNARLHGSNPNYEGVFVFENDLPCFSPDAPEPEFSDPFYVARAAKGATEVVCHHPDHGKTFADLPLASAEEVVRTWAARSAALAALAEVNHVLVFENKGELVGTSNPHPHSQVYASPFVYGTTEREVASSRRFYERTGEHLGQQVMRLEHASRRVVCENDEFLACVPWFARYAYEILILPRRPAHALEALDAGQQTALAALMREVCIRYDNLWQQPLPYVMAIHQAPCDGADYGFYPFHIEYHPPLRKPDTLKYLAGPEVGGGSMTNESNPDEKAAELRAVPATLYR